MKRNLFGDPRPKGSEEMIEALDEGEALADSVNAEISHSDEDGEYSGWCAEVRDSDTGTEIFSTLGYGDDKAALIADLKAAGITEINEVE